jgi:hypothetical protein
MRLSRARSQDGSMDLVAVLLAVVAFVALLALIEGLDRV